MAIMPGEPIRQPLLEAWRSYVFLEQDVSDALSSLHEREEESLSVVLSEARDLAGRLEPREDQGHQSQQDLESWLGAVLCGPHDERWFDERVCSHLRGWADLSRVASVVVIGRVRHRLTEIATITSAKLNHGSERITNAIARLFDLEMALSHSDFESDADTATVGEVDPLGALGKDSLNNIVSALGVIETSAYLVRRYSEQVAPGYANIARHVGRILKHVRRTNLEIVRLVGAARLRRHPAS